MSDDKQSREGLILRVLWMVLFGIVWQVAELVLLALVLVQLVLRLINGVPSRALMDFGDSLSQYLAQIGRFGCFHSDEKPWPFADWPVPRETEVEGAASLAPAASAATATTAGADIAVPPVVSEPQEEAATPAANAGEGAASSAEQPEVPAEVVADEVGEVKKEAGPDAPAEPKA